MIENNVWISMNNDFFVTSEAIRQWFSWMTKARVKIIAVAPHKWQKIIIHTNPYIILFPTCYFYVRNTQICSNNHWSLILHVQIGT